MAERIWASEEEHLELWRVNVNELKEQDRNAQVMPPEMMDRLTATIKRDKRLESFPFVVKRDGKKGLIFEVISGHHRARAARMAGVDEIMVIADTSDLNRSQVVAKQLAHNALAGSPDPAVVIEMFEEITSLEDALEAYAEPEMLRPELAEESDIHIDMVDIEEDWRMVNFTFLGRHLIHFEEVLARLSGDEDLIGLGDMQQFELFQRSVARISQKTKVRNVGALMVMMAKLAEQAMDEDDR